MNACCGTCFEQTLAVNAKFKTGSSSKISYNNPFYDLRFHFKWEYYGDHDREGCFMHAGL